MFLISPFEIVAASLKVVSAEFAVTFTETGLAPGTGWSVSAGGTLMFSASSTATILLPNGTFGYYLGFVPGYTTPSTSGVVNISGVPVSITVTFYGWANVTGPKGGLTEGQWVLVGSGVAAATIVGIALMIRRRRTREDDGETHKHAPL